MPWTTPSASQSDAPVPSRGVKAGVFGLAIASIIAASGLTRADDPLARDFMGAGMHAYFAGDVQRSVEDLSAAINAGSRDPRAYYFRALALLKQGREDEAIADMQQGAMFESSGPGGTVIARSLERIQGPHRLMLERYRRRALIEQQALDRRRIEQRYTDSIDREPEMLRQRRPTSIRDRLPSPPAATPDTPVPAEPPATVPPKARSADDPFGSPTPATPPAAPVDPGVGDDPFAIPGGDATPMPAESDDPFASPPPSAEGDDPFGDPADQPQTRPADAPDAGDLFDDPFGETSSAAGPAASGDRAVSGDNVADQVDEQVEAAAAEVDGRLDQMDEQEELGAAEAGDIFDQVDEQQEREAAAGEGGSVAEPIND